MTVFSPDAPADREAATCFVGRVAQLDPAGLVRLTGAEGGVDLWARAGFGVIATCRVAGRIEPDPLTVYATNLVAALAVSLAPAVDAGSDMPERWTTQLPPVAGWSELGELAGSDITAALNQALPVAQAAVEFERSGELRAKTKATVPPAVLDRALLSLPGPGGMVPISMRLVFALSGMGFAGESDPVRVRTTATWLRLDTAQGCVARRRMADLPLV